MPGAVQTMMRATRRWAVLLLTTVLGALAGAVYTSLQTPVYESQAYVLTVGEAGDAMSTISFAQAYGRMATMGPVGDLAAATLGPERAEGLSRVRASTSPEAPIIEITAQGDTPEDAADVANAAAQALVKFGVDYRVQTHVDLVMFAEAAPQSTAVSPHPPRDIAVGAAAGVLVGALVMLAGAGRRDETPTAPRAPVSGNGQAAPAVSVDQPHRSGLQPEPAVRGGRDTAWNWEVPRGRREGEVP